MNHIMFGEIGAWLYKALGGIKPDPDQPGFKNVLLEPMFVSRLDQVDVSHTGPYGTIRSARKRTATELSYDIVVPPNSTATLSLIVPDGKKVYENGRLAASSPKEIHSSGITTKTQKYQLQAGTYHFKVK